MSLMYAQGSCPKTEIDAKSLCMDAKPTSRPVDWSDLQLLVAVRTAGSMLRAARRLGLAASTVSRRMTSLEHAAGVPLVERGTEGVRMTPAGDALAACGAELETGVARALRELPRPGVAVTGTVRVSAGDGFADAIAAAAAACAAKHPGIRFELAFEDRVVNLVRREADVAVRTIHAGETSLVYRKVRLLDYGLFADVRYLAARGAPRRLGELARHDWVGFTPPLDRIPSQGWLRARTAKSPRLTASTFTGLLAAARAGVGLAALPVLSSGGLVPVLPGSDLPALPIWVVSHRDARRLPHVSAFAQALISELGSAP
jgi:DNA-binding transcriptional LysR family regulator